MDHVSTNSRLGWGWVCLLLGVWLTACAAPLPVRPQPVYERVGLASYYAHSLHGRQTASGERYNEKDMTAAHLSLPFGTRLTVVNLKNGRSVAVRINDRGPHLKSRIIDLSHAAAEQLGMLQDGIVRVRITALP